MIQFFSTFYSVHWGTLDSMAHICQLLYTKMAFIFVLLGASLLVSDQELQRLSWKDWPELEMEPQSLSKKERECSQRCVYIIRKTYERLISA